MKTVDTAKVLGVTRQRVQQLVKKGSLSAVRTDGPPPQLDIDEKSVVDLMLARTVETPRLDEMENRLEALETFISEATGQCTAPSREHTH